MNTAQVLHFDDVAEVAPSGHAPSKVSEKMLTTEGRMTRAGLNERERATHRVAIGRTIRDVGPDAGMAMRRSIEVHAELRRVLGADFGPRQ